MVHGPWGAPECTPVSISWLLNYFVAVIVPIGAALAPVGWPNIDDVTCLLTPSVALWGSQCQDTDGPLQGGRRRWKIPHCHHHNQFTHHRLYCPPCWRCQNQKTLALYFPMGKILSRSHENLLRNISYRAVLRFTQLQEVSYRSWMQGGHRCWKIPHCHHHIQSQQHCLYCYFPPHWRCQKQMTLMENIIHECIRDHPNSRLHILHPHNAR